MIFNKKICTTDLSSWTFVSYLLISFFEGKSDYEQTVNALQLKGNVCYIYNCVPDTGKKKSWLVCLC